MAAIAGVPASIVMPSSPAATVAVVIVALVIVVFIVCGVWEAFASDIHTIGEESIATPHPKGGFKLTITPSGDWNPVLHRHLCSDLSSDQFRVWDGWSGREIRNQRHLNRK